MSASNLNASFPISPYNFKMGKSLRPKFTKLLLLIAFTLSGSLLFAQKAPEPGNGKMFIPEPDKKATPVEYYASEVFRVGNRHLNWGFHTFNASPFLETYQGEGVVVVILDTGIDDHPEFGDRVKYKRDFTDENNTQDQNGHGNHVAGTVAGENTGFATKATIGAGKVLESDGYGLTKWGADGIYWAIDHCGAQVINMSLGFSSPDIYVEDAIAYAMTKSVLIVCANGNQGNDPIKDTGNYPAKYAAKYWNVIPVGALNHSKLPAQFSSSNHIYGKMTMFAGVNIMSTLPNGKYGEMSGTSMSSPAVAGICAGLLSAGYTAREIVELFVSYTVDIDGRYGEGWDTQSGNGYLDIPAVAENLKRKKEVINPVDTTKTINPIDTNKIIEEPQDTLTPPPSNEEPNTDSKSGGIPWLVWVLLTVTLVVGAGVWFNIQFNKNKTS